MTERSSPLLLPASLACVLNQSYKRRRQKVSANKELSHPIVKPCLLVGGQAGAHVARTRLALRCLSARGCNCANAHGIIHMCLCVILV